MNLSIIFYGVLIHGRESKTHLMAPMWRRCWKFIKRFEWIYQRRSNLYKMNSWTPCWFYRMRNTYINKFVGTSLGDDGCQNNRCSLKWFNNDKTIHLDTNKRWTKSKPVTLPPVWTAHLSDPDDGNLFPHSFSLLFILTQIKWITGAEQ